MAGSRMAVSESRRRQLAAVAFVIALSATGCGDGGGEAAAPPTDLTIPNTSCAPLEENLRTLQGVASGDVDGEQAQAALVQVRAIVGNDAPGLAEVTLAVSALAEAGEDERTGVMDAIGPGLEQALDGLQGAIDHSCPAVER